MSIIHSRVVVEERGAYRLSLGIWAELSGKLRHEALSRLELPAVGDWIEARYEPGQERALITGVRERRGCLLRKEAGGRAEAQILAANVDVAFLVMSANLDFNPRRLERYLALAWDGGARPVVLVTKADLAADVGSLVAQVEAVALGAPVHSMSVVSGEGLEVLDTYLKAGVTTVLLGSSGVGKSTLANHLLGFEALETQEVRESDDRGRHTTTARHLFELPSGATLIDTPGMRELALWADDDGEGGGSSLGHAFADVEALAAACRFNDCGHETEPGCAVRGAIEAGELDPERWASFVKLEREIAFHSRRRDKAEESRVRAKWKKIHSQARQHMKRKRWEE